MKNSLSISVLFNEEWTRKATASTLRIISVDFQFWSKQLQREIRDWNMLFFVDFLITFYFSMSKIRTDDHHKHVGLGPLKDVEKCDLYGSQIVQWKYNCAPLFQDDQMRLHPKQKINKIRTWLALVQTHHHKTDVCIRFYWRKIVFHIDFSFLLHLHERKSFNHVRRDCKLYVDSTRSTRSWSHVGSLQSL